MFQRIMRYIKNLFRYYKITLLFGCATALGVGIVVSITMHLSRQPNIIFITLDALRMDHLGCYGYRRNTSAHIDSLSSRGVIFNQAISQAPWTPASVSSVITSQYPPHEYNYKDYHLSPDSPNLIAILKNNGYHTAIFSNADPVLFMTLSEIKVFFDSFYICNKTSALIVEQAMDWLAKHRKQPFFAWVYLYEPHGSYTAAPLYYNDFLSDDLYVPKNVAIAKDDGVKNEFYSFGVIPRYVAEKDISDAGYYIAKYDGKIKSVDEQIGKLFDKLEELKLRANTIIVLFSDHGEALGDHNLYFNHSHSVYEELIRVPLIITLPQKGIKNKSIKQQVQLIDIMPTIMDMLRIKDTFSTQGVSFYPLLIGKTNRHLLYAFAESFFWPKPQCVRTEKWKLIYKRSYKHYELYNLEKDPFEKHNVIADYPSIASSLRQTLEEHNRNALTHKIQTNNVYLETGQDLQKLKSLGYMQ